MKYKREVMDMGNYNPGRFRKEGREAFEPNCNPDDLNPYLKSKGFWADSNAGNWLEGWKEAEEAFEEIIEDQCDYTHDDSDLMKDEIISGDFNYCPGCGIALKGGE